MPSSLHSKTRQNPTSESDDSKRHVAATGDSIAQNVETVVALQLATEQRSSRHERTIERVVRILGRPVSVLSILGAVGVWIVINVALGHHAVDPPPFSFLQAVTGVAALVTTVMILSVQYTQGRRADQRAHLDLQVNLLAEQKIAKLISLVEELRRDLPNVHNRRDSLAEAMIRPVDPHAVASALETTLEHPPASSR